MRDAYDPSALSALTTATIGIGFALGPRLAIVAEVDGMFAWPTTDVKVDPEIVATFGGPALFTHAGLLATF